MPHGAEVSLKTKTEWMESAACQGHEELFLWPSGGFSMKKNQPAIKKALKLCSFCPVLSECQDWSKNMPWSGVIVAGQIIGG